MVTHGLVLAIDVWLIDVDLLLIVHHAAVVVIQATVSTFAAFLRFLGVLTGLSHIIIVNIICSSVDSVSSNEKSISLLLALHIHHWHLEIASKLLLRLILHAACSFVHFISSIIIRNYTAMLADT